MAAVLTGLTPLRTAQRAGPGVRRARAAGRASSGSVPSSSVGAIAGLASVVLVMLMGQPRIFYAMSRDGLLPQVFGSVHERYRTPYVATIVTGHGCRAGRAGCSPSACCRAGIHRHAAGVRHRLRRHAGAALHAADAASAVPRAVRVVPCLAGAGFCGWLMVSLPLDTWVRLVVWAVIGVCVYFLYGRHHSRLRAAAHEPM